MKEILKNLDWDDFGAALGMVVAGLIVLAVVLFLLTLYVILLFTHPLIWLLLTLIVGVIVGGAVALLYLDKKHEWYMF